MNLRPYQTAIVDAISTELKWGRTKILVQLVAGGGKTRLASHLAVAEITRGSPVLWVAAREELIRQAFDTIRAETTNVGMILAGEITNPSALIQVCSLQTLLARDYYPPAGMVIVDETRHYSEGNTWGGIFDKYKDATVIGLDATPVNSTGSAIKDFEVLIPGPSVKDLIALGFLVPANIVYPGKLLKPKCIAQSPLAAWQQHAGGKQALVFCQNKVAGAEHLAEFQAAGISAAFATHETPNRRALLEQFKSGKLQILINQNLYTEGLDYPELPCVILARKCGNDEIYVQITARAMRPAPGKTAALILDLAGNAFSFGSPEDERTYTLGGTVSKNGSKLQFRFCATCGVVLNATPGAICVDCTALGVQGVQIAAPKVTGDRLVRFAGINKRAPMDRKTHYFKMMRELENRGKNIKGAFHKYKSIYNKPDGSPEEPPWSWLSEYMVSPERYKK